MSVDLFEILDDLTVKKKPFDRDNEEYVKGYPVFMVNRFVSMVDLYLPIINELNKYPDIPKSAHYRYLNQTLPKRKHWWKVIEN